MPTYLSLSTPHLSQSQCFAQIADLQLLLFLDLKPQPKICPENNVYLFLDDIYMYLLSSLELKRSCKLCKSWGYNVQHREHSQSYCNNSSQ